MCIRDRQYHAGIIKTDGVSPSPGGEEYIQFIKEIKDIRKQYKPEAPRANESDFGHFEPLFLVPVISTNAVTLSLIHI